MDSKPEARNLPNGKRAGIHCPGKQQGVEKRELPPGSISGDRSIIIGTAAQQTRAENEPRTNI